jgi:hypothetical protein
VRGVIDLPFKGWHMTGIEQATSLYLLAHALLIRAARAHNWSGFRMSVKRA